MGFILSHYFITFLTVLCAYIFGRRILIKVKFHSVWEDLSFSTTMGLGVLIFIVMILGFLHLLYIWLVIALVIVLLGTSFPVYKSWPVTIFKYFKEPKPFYLNPIIILISASILLYLLQPIFKMPLYPPYSYDANYYHLPLAKYFSNWHGIEFTPYLRFPAFPMNIQMLFTLMLLVSDDLNAQLMHFSFYALTTIALIGWGYRLQSLRSGIWAAVLFFSSSHFFMHASLANVDLGVTLFVTMAIYAFLNWLSEHDEKWLWIAAVFCGLGAGSKYSAIVFPVLIGAATIYFDFRARKFRYFLLFSLITILVCAPWYIRNIIIDGNPVFPFLGDIFGYNLWDENDKMRDLESYGYGTSLISFFKIPWGLVYDKSSFAREVGPLSLMWLILLPIGIVTGNFKSPTRWILSFCLIYYIFWMGTAQVLRYLDPILPMIALTSTIGLDWLISKIGFLNRKWPSILTAVLFIVVITGPGILIGWQIMDHYGPIPVSEEEREEFLLARPNERFETIPLYKLLNERYGSDYSVYAINDKELTYYADGILMGDWFGVARYKDILEWRQGSWHFLESEKVYEILHDKLEADYLIINYSNLRIDSLPNDQFWNAHFQPFAGTNTGDIQHTVLIKILD